jgi:uncharacterized protein YbjT (DUF2867 family)
MTRYAVIGASSGTGREIVRYLAERKIPVRAISRSPGPQQEDVEPFAADVTDPASIAKALEGGFDAVFYTVDIHGRRLSREAVRKVMYDGAVNAIRAAVAGGAKRFVLLSVIGPERPSWVWWLLNAMKPGMRDNIIDREQVLKASGIDYVVLRAPKLNDKRGGQTALAATEPKHRLAIKMGIARTDLARALVRAAETAPSRTTWDVFTGQTNETPGWLRPAAPLEPPGLSSEVCRPADSDDGPVAVLCDPAPTVIHPR